MKLINGKTPKGIILIAALTALSLLLTACSADAFDGIPKEIQKTLTDYFIACKEEPERALEYRYWASESDKQLTYSNITHILNYEVKTAEKVNDSLYAFTILIQDTAMPEQMIKEDAYRQIYNYVANIEGQWYVLANEKDIPESIKGGFDSSKYTYDFALIEGNASN